MNPLQQDLHRLRCAGTPWCLILTPDYRECMRSLCRMLADRLRVRHGSILCEQSRRKLHQRMDTNETPEAQVPQIAQSGRRPWVISPWSHLREA